MQITYDQPKGRATRVQGMQQSEMVGKQAGLSAKKLAFIWLFGAVVGWSIQYLHRWLSPSTAGDYFPFESLFGDACAVMLILWKWPGVFTLSRIKPRWSDLPIGMTIGYLDANIIGTIIGKGEYQHDLILTFPARTLTFICAVLIVPLVEELIYRGAILGSLLQRTSAFWAAIITVIAATLMHDYWRTAIASQILICAAYFIPRRSIPASVTAHAVANALIFAPNLLIVFHMR